MKKIFTLIVATMATLTMSAQLVGNNALKLEGALQKQPTEIAKPVIKKAPRKALAANQQYMGAYTTDEYSTGGLGLPSYPGTYEMYADIPSSLLSAYDGGKVVGMRFAVSYACNTSRCYIYNYNNNEMSLLAEGTVTSSTAGWNTVMFDTPFTLDLSTIGELMMGYDYVQANTKSGNDYTNDCYPLSVSTAGVICTTYLYGNLGSGEGFYNIGFSNYGNLCVQAIVEKEYAQNAVGGFSGETAFVQLNEAANLPVYLQNWGTEGVKNLTYTTTCDGVTSEENTITLDSPCKDFAGIFSVNIPIEAQAEANTKIYTITITKVNGETNDFATNTVNGTVVTVKEFFPHRVAMEEFTGTGCGWCPRGWVALNLLNEKYGENYIGIAVHQYNSGDPMYISKSNYASLSWSGAPNSMVERSDEVDPYYGSEESIMGIYGDIDAALAEIAPAGVEVEGAFSDDMKTVDATASVKSFTDGDTYDLEFILTADSLCNSTWSQSNYYYQYTAANADATGTPLADFCSGGTYAKSSVKGLIFNDVAIASSYKSSSNQVETITCATAYEPTETSFTLTMPTKTALLTAIQNAGYNVNVVALVVDHVSGEIINAAKAKVQLPAAIKEVNINENTNNNVMYNIAGQRVNANAKGIVIVNGKKIIK